MHSSPVSSHFKTSATHLLGYGNDTAVEFAQAIDYDYTTIMRWLRRGLVPGAKFVEVSGKFGVWQIPQEALTMTPPRLGRKRGTKASKKASRKGSAK